MKKTTYGHLGQAQRYQIQAFLKAGKNKAFIASELGCARSTIYREIARNSTQSGSGKPPDHYKYKAKNAQDFADRRAYRKPPLKSIDLQVCRRLHFLLPKDWSPEQIAKSCKVRGIQMLSVESIYKWIYELRKKTGGPDYVPNLRQGHRKRRKRRLLRRKRAIIPDRISIAQRPVIVAQGTRAGDLETDLVKCTNGYLVTVTDRKTLFNLAAIVPNKEAGTVAAALKKLLLPLKSVLFTITSDNGAEFVRHKEVAEALDIDWYFADPYCSQQRGCNENQNGLFRQYFPLSFDLNTCTHNYLHWIQNKLNYRPRKKHNFITPIKLFPKIPGVALGT